jgi:hypothetical protein
MNFTGALEWLTWGTECALPRADTGLDKVAPAASTIEGSRLPQCMP